MQDTGVNPDVFQSMPPSLQQEVLRPASAAAAPSGAPAESSAPVPMETQDAAAQPESSAAAVAGLLSVPVIEQPTEPVA